MSSVRSTTQSHLDIADIKNNTVVLTSGGACAILETNAINFKLLSPMEQDAAIASFSALLNSLTFPIQITIRSKKMDISEYLEKIKEIEEKQTNNKIREQIMAYRTYIKDELVKKEEVLDKDFYVTIPHRIITASAINPISWIDEIMGRTEPRSQKVNVDRVLQEATAELTPRITFLINEFKRMGIKSRQLTSSELIKLFYEIYNSESSRSQKIKSDIKDYTSVLVEPKLK